MNRLSPVFDTAWEGIQGGDRETKGNYLPGIGPLTGLTRVWSFG